MHTEYRCKHCGFMFGRDKVHIPEYECHNCYGHARRDLLDNSEGRSRAVNRINKKKDEVRQIMERMGLLKKRRSVWE